MNRVELLKEAATLLAAQPSAQLKHLEEIGTPDSLDELALEYGDIASAAKDMQLSGELDAAQYNATSALDHFLSEISGDLHRDLWRIESLSSASEWKYVRKLASELVKLLSKG